MAEKGTVCVTGAGGYIASWLIKLLLSAGYTVHGTVRDPSDAKNAYLWKLEKASENLRLFKAELLDYGSVHKPIQGCRGVFHVASPVPLPFSSVQNPEVEMVEPAVKGTLNVVKASHEAKVKRVIVVSSAAAVSVNPDWPKGEDKDENCWSDTEYCRTNKKWYPLSKTEAERAAIEYAEVYGLDVVTVCPTLVLGPLLQSNVNSSSLFLLGILRDGYETLRNELRRIVDVRDVAEALVLVSEKPEARGRYICTAHMIQTKDLIDRLKTIYPNYNYPKKITEMEPEEKLTSAKLQKLGWSYKPLEETLVDSIENYKQAGFLN